MEVKQLVSRMPGKDSAVLGRFYLDGDRAWYVVSLWGPHDDWSNLECVIGPPPDFRQLSPADGRVWFDSLEREFANAMFQWVERV